MKTVGAGFRRFGLIVVLFGCSALEHTALGQRQRAVPFAEPERFFEKLFGEETEAEREALRRIKISYRDESRFGSSAARQFVSQLKQRGVKILDRGPDVDYLRSLVNQLRPQMKNARRYRKVNVLVADTEDTDARSFPGGTLVIFRGLIDYCESEAAIVGILGHELSHVDRGHQLYYMRRWKQAEQSFQSKRFDARKMMDLASMMAKTFSRPFRPEEETEADLDGARWAFELGYDPTEMARVFLKLHQRDGAKATSAPAFFRSHPFHHNRYTAILKESDRLARQKKDTDLFVGKQNLQQRIPRKKKELED